MESSTVTPRSTRGLLGGRSRYLRRLAAVFLLGLPGVIAATVHGVFVAPAEGIEISPIVLFVNATLLNAVILLVSVAVGAYAAPRVGLRSHLLARVTGDPAPAGRFQGDLPAAVGLGAAAGAILLVVDAVAAPFVPDSLTNASDATVQSVLAFAPVRFLYGGITEELLLRFGFMALLAFVGFRLLNRGRERPSGAVVWGSILLSALLFGLGHLPATAAVVELTPAVVARGLFLNGFAGILFGWLYWRRSLEAAMVAHVALHVVLVTVSLVLAF